MAELDEIAVCDKCLVPVEGGGKSCPVCGLELKAGFPSLLLATLRSFKAKGWVVESHSFETREALSGSSRYVFVLGVTFYRLAPPVVDPDSAKVGQFMTKEARVLPMMSGYGSPGLRVEGWQKLTVFRAIREFAEKAPKLSLPFWAEMCGKCHGQGGNWMYSECKCPVGSKSDWQRFADGMPDKCAYAPEQVMSMEERTGIMVRLFEGHPISQRMLRRRV